MADTSGLPTISESPSTNESRIRQTKRKLDDAFHILDNAVSSNDTTDRPPPPKRSNTIKSLYSTLAKYGIKTKEPSTPLLHKPSRTKSTPHLDAILSRAASRTKNSLSFRLQSHSPSPTPFLPATAEYRPSSLPSFLSRLSTYKLSTYANKPAAINAVAASRCGWINDGKDRLVCGLCNASWVAAGREGLSRDAANTLVQKQRISLVEAHKTGCPWKTRQCDDTIYCTPLQSPGAMIREIKGRAAIMDPVIKDVFIKHPLTATYLNAFISTVSSYTIPELPSSPPTGNAKTQSLAPSETALLAALFGWSLVSPAPLALRRASTTRANSGVSSPSPPFSRASSVALSQTPAKPGPSHATPAIVDKQRLPFTFQVPSNLTDKPENALLQCALCQRRIGLWSFTNRGTATPTSDDSVADSLTRNGNNDAESGPNPLTLTTPSRPMKSLPQRAFDLLKEHRSYCPYTVRSTVVPSLPVPPAATPNTPKRSSSISSFIFNGHTNNSTTSLPRLNGSANAEGPPGSLEGWRAALTVVLRYGMAEKQRIEYNFLAPREDGSALEGRTEEAEGMEVDNVRAMVHGVKTRGGKDLLKYVKSLLG